MQLIDGKIGRDGTIAWQTDKHVFVNRGRGMIIYAKSNIGKELKDIRKKCKYTQLEVANAIGLTKVSVIKIEKGITSPKVSTVCDWLRFCNYELILRKHEEEEEDIELD